MDFSETDARKLELLLESLIKMVGKSNQKVDHLQERVNQLECFIREQLADHRHQVGHVSHDVLAQPRIYFRTAPLAPLEPHSFQLFHVPDGVLPRIPTAASTTLHT